MQKEKKRKEKKRCQNLEMKNTEKRDWEEQERKGLCQRDAKKELNRGNEEI